VPKALYTCLIVGVVRFFRFVPFVSKFVTKLNIMERIYFDTSVINCLLDDSLSYELISSLKKSFQPYLSFFTIIELLATSDKQRRIKLVNLAKSILGNYRPLARPGDLLKRSLQARYKSISEFNASITDEDDSLWYAVNNPEQINDDDYREIRQEKVRQEDWFKEMYKTARPLYQKEFRKATKREKEQLLSKPSCFLRFAVQYLFESMLMSLVKKADNAIPSEFVKRYARKPEDVWCYFLMGIFYSMYIYCVQTSNYSYKKNISSIDTQQSIYLGVSDIFVTNDTKQYEMLKIISPFGVHQKKIWLYSEFKKLLKRR